MPPPLDETLAAIKARCDADANYLDMPRREGLRAVHEFNVHARTDVPRLVAALQACMEFAEMGEGAIRCDWRGQLAAILAGENDGN